MVSADRTIEIHKDVIAGSSREGYSKEENDLRDKMEIRNAQHKSNGTIPDLPHEWPEFTDQEISDIKAKQAQNRK